MGNSVSINVVGVGTKYEVTVGTANQMDGLKCLL
jgi:hypothetical protein